MNAGEEKLEIHQQYYWQRIVSYISGTMSHIYIFFLSLFNL